MRVYDLARELGMPSRDVIALVRAEDEWVGSHLSSVAEPVARRLIQRYPAPKQESVPVHPMQHPAETAASLEPRPESTRLWRPMPRLRERPGPKRITFQQPPLDDYDDPVENLRYEEQLPTGDVAELLGVTPAAVRQWVRRGYIVPAGRIGSSHLFNTCEVIRAFHQIEQRRRATGEGLSGRRQFTPAIEIPSKLQDRMITVAEAARLVDVSPATIRAWIHRGHLKPLPGSRARQTLLRVGDVIATARGRHVPLRGPSRRRRL